MSSQSKSAVRRKGSRANRDVARVAVEFEFVATVHACPIAAAQQPSAPPFSLNFFCTRSILKLPVLH
jgi:hypothetical protein